MFLQKTSQTEEIDLPSFPIATGRLYVLIVIIKTLRMFNSNFFSIHTLQLEKIIMKVKWTMQLNVPCENKWVIIYFADIDIWGLVFLRKNDDGSL